jgi:ornithine carbamoyltransferase
MTKTNNVILTQCALGNQNVTVTDEVCDGPRSIVYYVAENRLHVQKVIMALTMGKG